MIGQDGCEGGYEAHHLIPRGQGGDDVISNGITLCHKHHEKVTRHEIKPEELKEAFDKFYGVK